MTLFIIGIPIMLLAVVIATVPLIAVSRSELRDIAAEFERKVEQYRLAHQAHQAHQANSHQVHDARPDEVSERAPLNGIESQPLHVPVLVGEA